jgi:hypothetical protein
MKTYRIAAVPGDGVGPEVIPAGLTVLGKAARIFGFAVEMTHFEWGAGYYKKHGHFMPKNGLDVLRPFDAVYFGAVGLPDVAAALIEIVRGIDTAPRYILAKGGITSHDIAAKALGVQRAAVLGQIIPGVPVRRLGEGSRFPGMSYIVSSISLPPVQSVPPKP